MVHYKHSSSIPLCINRQFTSNKCVFEGLIFNIADYGLVGSPASQTEVPVFDDLGLRLNIIQLTSVNPWYAVQQKQLYLCQ